MFYFKNWDLSYDGQVLAMQFDNLTRTISLQGDLPDGWDWVMEVGFAGNHDIIQLAPVSGGLEATLTRDNLAFAGWYEMQLRGNQGDLERRTNIIRIHVPRSLSGTGQWPTVPTEFTQIEQRIADLNAHPSIPGQNGFWLVWDPETQQYKDSEYPLPDVSVGPAGKAATIEVAETVTGEPGSAADVVNIGDENAARLRFTIPRGQAGPVGATPQISVTVETLPSGSKATVEVTGTPEKPEIALGIPQGAQGERGPQGIQGVQGWSVSAAALDDDGALVLTIRNPADGSTQTLPPVPIDNSAALQAVGEAIIAQGTAQVQRVETAGSTAVGEVSTAKDAALQAVGQAQSTATGAVSSAQSTAVQAVQTAQGSATDAIGAAQTAAVGAVNDAKTAAMEAVETKGAEEQEKLNAIVPPPTPEDAGKALVVKEDGTGLKYDDLPGGAGIDDAVIATNSTWSSRMVVDSLAPAFSETGSVVTCNPVANYPLSIQAQIVPVQEGTGDPSPDNVRPISGRTGVNLWAGGKNIIDVEKYGDLSKSGVQITVDPENQTITIDGTTSGAISSIPVSTSLHIPAGNVEYSIRVIPVAGTITPNSEGMYGTFTFGNRLRPIDRVSAPLNGGENNKSLNTSDICYSLYIQSGISFENYTIKVQVEVSPASTSYTPYNPSSKKITVPFGQTVYGGTLDWTTGVLTITHEKVIFDGSEEWAFGSQFNGYSSSKEHKYKDEFLPICNIAKGAIRNEITGYSIRANYNSFRFQGFADKYPDVDSFKAFLQTQNAEIIAELVTPITVQLTPQEILALSGVNTIYADTGDVTVAGRADPNAVIQQLAARIAALESAAVANA